MHTGIKVMNIMTRNPVMVNKDLDVESCSKEMLKQKVGSVLVLQDKKLLGMVTEKDILEKVVSQGKDPKNTKISKIMTTTITTTHPGEDIYYAILKMRNSSVRRLPVLNQEEEVIGLLTLNDILRVHPDLFEIMVEKLRIREENTKLTQLEGNCSECGTFSSLFRNKGQLVCSTCNHHKIY